MRIKSGFAYRSITVLAAGAVAWALCFANVAGAQGIYRSSGINGLIDAGTTVAVRTTDMINTRNNDGRVFPGERLLRSDAMLNRLTTNASRSYEPRLAHPGQADSDGAKQPAPAQQH